MQQHRFRTKMNYNQTHWILTAYTWLLKSGLCSTFHLNHFKAKRCTKIIEMKCATYQYLSTHVYAVCRPGSGYNSFWFETDVVAFFQRFSHVVLLRFSCMSPCKRESNASPSSSRRQLGVKFGRIFGPRAWATLWGHFEAITGRYCSENSSPWVTNVTWSETLVPRGRVFGTITPGDCFKMSS